MHTDYLQFSIYLHHVTVSCITWLVENEFCIYFQIFNHDHNNFVWAVIIVLVIRQREIFSHRHDTNPVCERGCVVFLYIGTMTVPKATDDALCDGMKGPSLRQATVMVKPTDRTQRNPNSVKRDCLGRILPSVCSERGFRPQLIGLSDQEPTKRHPPLILQWTTSRHMRGNIFSRAPLLNSFFGFVKCTNSGFYTS